MEYLALEGLPMPRKTPSKPKLTDAERRTRFVEMALEVGASDDPKDFANAFKKVAPGNRAEPEKGAR